MIGYNTVSVFLGAGSVGLAAGMIGAFMILRKRALLSDAVSHATLPGLGLGFLLALSLGLQGGRYLPLLLLGAVLSGALGGYLVQAMKRYTKLSGDAAMSIVISVFYGLGVVLLSFIQQVQSAGKSGLEHFLLGQVGGLLFEEALVLCAISVFVLFVMFLFFRAFTVLCFDESFAECAGMPVRRVDMILFSLMLLIVCAGLKVLGVILILALLIIPACAARLWCRRAGHMVVLSGVFGASSVLLGAFASIYIEDMPTGPAIVLVAFLFFLFSLAAYTLRYGGRMPA